MSQPLLRQPTAEVERAACAEIDTGKQQCRDPRHGRLIGAYIGLACGGKSAHWWVIRASLYKHNLYKLVRARTVAQGRHLGHLGDTYVARY